MCQSCTFFSAEDQLFAESFLPNLSSWKLLQRHVTGLVAGPSDCWALEWQRGESGESVDVILKLCFAMSTEVDRLMVKVSLSHQVTFTFFFAAEFFVILSCMISNTIPLLHPKCNILLKTVRPKFLCQSAIVVFSIFGGRGAGPYSYTCHSHHRRSWWLLHASFVSSYVGAPNIDPWPGCHP